MLTEHEKFVLWLHISVDTKASQLRRADEYVRNRVLMSQGQYLEKAFREIDPNVFRSYDHLATQFASIMINKKADAQEYLLGLL
jgi:Tfp pilus assembly protein PilF